MRRLLIACLAASMVAAADPPALVDLAETVGDAGTPLRVRLAAAAGCTLAWTLADWDGRPEAEGMAVAGADGQAEIAVSAPAGWHELRAGELRCGIILREGPPAARPDPFFCADAAVGELVRGAQSPRRGRFAALLPRLGIDLARERLHWDGVHPAPERWVWETRFQEDSLHAAYARHGVGVLEMFHYAPGWLGRIGGVYPGDPVGCAGSWRTICGRWRGTVRAVEVWNEPDAPEYSADSTVDQLAALTRAVGWGVRQGAPDALVCGGAVTYHADDEYLRMLFANGLLAASDAMTFHDYRAAEALQPWVANLRRLMAAAGEGGMPLWITEAGHAWPAGAGRPEAAADQASARGIALRTVEARACGIARHFAFVLPWYEEGRKNYGLTGRDGSPLRALAGYSHLARRLAGLAYAGDLALAGAPRCRVFAGGGRAVAVAALAAGGRLVPGDLPLRSVHGLDGRRLSPTASGGWIASEDVLVLELDPAALARVRPDPATWALWQAGQAVRPRPVLPAVQMQIVPTPGEVVPCQTRYTVAAVPGGAALCVRVANLGATPAVLAGIDLAVPAGGRAAALSSAAGLAIPAGGAVELTWLIAACAPGDWRLSGRLADGVALPPVVFRTEAEIDGAALLARVPAGDRRDLTPAELSACDRNIAPGVAMTATAPSDGGWRLDLDFSAQGAGNWAFPRVPLPAEARGRYDAVLLRARARQPAAVRFFAFVPGGTGNIGWWKRDLAMASDGAWHWVLVRFGDLTHCHATEPDPAGRLDPARIDRISLGMNNRFSSRNTLEIASCTLVRLGGGP